MPAHDKNFPWTSYYGHYNYFEQKMRNHGKVASLNPKGNGVYDLNRIQGDTLRLFICECYAFGVAEYMETLEQLSNINAVIINSAWCGYSPDAKRHCREANVGLFNIGGFMAALHRDKYWEYLTEEEKEYFKTQGWL